MEKTKKNNAIITYDKKRLEDLQNLGMRYVDPADIRPPMIILIQPNTKTSDFVDLNGNTPKPGQFFHNGSLRILDSFECYFIWAGKGRYIDRHGSRPIDKPVYRAIGIMADDFSIFGIRFKGTNIYGLSPLFTTVMAKKRAMFSIRCKLSSEYIQSIKGDWYVIVVRVVGFEENPEKLAFLEKMAMNYDTLGNKIVKEIDDDEDKKKKKYETETETQPEKEKLDEEVNLNDIPF